jgi:hypothetical protein
MGISAVRQALGDAPEHPHDQAPGPVDAPVLARPAFARLAVLLSPEFGPDVNRTRDVE